ncbi:glycosyltransferase [Bacteroides fragilis]|nr:glycosyltransferase [Bacteroides fragilis]MCE9303904.1 glycosyltransferase [Bacteroides fragilis]
MKALFLIFHGFEEANGISKKIRYQVKALKECGMDVRICYLTDENGHKRRMVDNNILKDYGNGIRGKLLKRFEFQCIANYALKENIQFVYIRSYHNANPFTLRLVKELKRQGIKIVMEIPTYPYDQEYITRRMKLDLLIDQCFRRQLAAQLDGIVTFSDAKTIFGGRTIRISNGIDFNAIPQKTNWNDTSHELHLIGVAEVHYWHGFDRIVKGMANYYATTPSYKIYFHIVGALTGERERQEILPIIAQNKLEPYVVLHGPQQGKYLDKLFEQSNFAIGSLARHRSGITIIKTLKNREYAARGIPFIYSEIDTDFDDKPYVLKATADETPIQMETILNFYRQQVWNSGEIRESVSHLSWKSQMQKVVKDINI